MVKGAKRTIICDIQRRKAFPIPESLVELLIEAEYNSLAELLLIYKNQNEIISEYFTFLSDFELGFWSDIHERFPSFNMEWDTAELINNAILEINNQSLTWLPKAISELDTLFCKYIELRVTENCINVLELFAFLTKKLRVRGIVSYIKFDDNFEKLDAFLKKNMRFINIIVHSVPEIELESAKINSNDRISISRNEIKNTSCGIINKSNFDINIPTFTEAQKHNTCLNRKISIDAEGFIRNCPSMKENFGNIKDTTLQQALDHPDFKKYWFVNKDQISVCKDCEFRYICTDCRAYIENPEDMYSKPLKCGYTPYTGVWEEWSTNPLKQKAIDHYEIRALIQK